MTLKVSYFPHTLSFSITVLKAVCVYGPSAALVVIKGCKSHYDSQEIKHLGDPNTHAHTAVNECVYELMWFFSVLNEPCLKLYGLDPFVFVWLCISICCACTHYYQLMFVALASMFMSFFFFPIQGILFFFVFPMIFYLKTFFSLFLERFSLKPTTFELLNILWICSKQEFGFKLLLLTTKLSLKNTFWVVK